MSEGLPPIQWVFELVLAASGYAAALAVLVIAADLVAGRLLAPRHRHALWLLVVARLVLPVAPETSWSAFNTITPWLHAPEASAIRDVPESKAGNVQIETAWSGTGGAAAYRPA